MKKTVFFIMVIMGLGVTTVAFAEAAKTIGWIEHVKLHSRNMLMKAKIDTGADNSSINARNIKIFEKDNVRMVSFTVENYQGEVAEFTQPLIRIANIKRKGAEPLKRPVVNMSLCIGNTLRSAHVNLANRENFKYRMLIGRSFLKDLFLVNSNKKHMAEPNCQSEVTAQKDSV